jgi:SAM-dependent methyltransferase
VVLGSPRLAARPPTLLDRPVLPDAAVERARRERLAPHPDQWDYRHLEGLRQALIDAFRAVGPTAGPVLDLCCGTQPYRELIPAPLVVGVDVDRHFGRADVVAGLPLPFRDGVFEVAVCTQALHLVDDPVRTVAELRRTVAPGGRLVATVPHLFLAEGDFERHWRRSDVHALLADWDDVRITGIDGPATAAAFAIGRLLMLASHRLAPLRRALPRLVRLLHAVSGAVDGRARAVSRRWPHTLLVVATRPVGPP